MFRVLMQVALSIFLPIYLTSSGKSIWVGGSALAMVELAGAVGALSAGILSDRFDRRWVIFVALLIGPLMILLFLTIESASGPFPYLCLAIAGFFAFSTNPVILAMVQDYGREYPATANGFFMGISFLITAGASPLLGWLGDGFGLRTAFLWSAILALFAAGTVALLPGGGSSPTGDIIITEKQPH